MRPHRCAHRSGRLAGGLLVAAGLILPVRAAAVADRRPAIESRMLQLVNEARARQGLAPYTAHAGLVPPARQHSQEQAAAGRLTHDGFEDRLNHAAPDPAEPDGAPDDGFWENGLAACENAANYYKSGTPDNDEQVAQRFFDMWRNSPPHRQCLFDEWGYGLNVTGIGLYMDAKGMWWGTMEVARDYTPPGSGPPPAPTTTAQPAVQTPPPEPAATRKPAAPATPRSTPHPSAPAAPVVATTPAPGTPVPPTPREDCRFDFWLLRVNRC
jgi:uncharacterized protein YkwD